MLESMLKYGFLMLGVVYAVGTCAVSIFTNANAFECMVAASFGAVFFGIFWVLESSSKDK